MMCLHVQWMLGDLRDYPALVVAGQRCEAARQKLKVVEVGFSLLPTLKGGHVLHL